MREDRLAALPFNSAFETGLRSVGILVAAYPRAFDLQRLVAFDHLVVHTSDVGGPDSLHAAVPMRSAELLVRRGLVERGLMLMASRGLTVRSASRLGICYQAGEFAETFLASLTSPYILALRDRAAWIVGYYADLTDEELREELGSFFDQWLAHFQVAHKSLTGEL